MSPCIAGSNFRCSSRTHQFANLLGSAHLVKAEHRWWLQATLPAAYMGGVTHSPLHHLAAMNMNRYTGCVALDHRGRGGNGRN